MVAPPTLNLIDLGKASASYKGALTRRRRLGQLSARTVENYSADLTEFVRLLGKSVIVDEITAADLEDAVDAFAAAPDRRFITPGSKTRSVAATNRFMQSIRIFFSYALRQHWIQADPWRYTDLRPGKAIVGQERKSITPEQALLLMAVGAGEPPESDDTRSTYWRDRFVLALLVVTGCRVSEACSSNQGDIVPTTIDGQQHMLWHVHGKGSKERPVPLSPHLIEVWGDYRARRPGPGRALTDEARRDAADALLLTRNGARLTPRDVQRLLTAASKRVAAVDPTFTRTVTPHGLRHTTATTLLADGVNVKQVRDLLGHESLRTLSRYLDTLPGELADIFLAHPLTPS